MYSLNRPPKTSIVTISNTHQKAFTIVELLVVIVVIGILATITIISYTGISAKAIDASITADLSNALKKFKMHQVENSGYPTTIDCTTATSATNICIKPSANNQYTLTTDNSVASNQYFCISILNTSSNKRLYINSDNITGAGACPFVLTLIAGTGGTVTGGGSYDTGTIQTITASPSSTDYSFNSWTGDTGCSGIAGHTITMNANKTCTANFTYNWISGIAATPMANKKIRNTDLGTMYAYKTSTISDTSPQSAIGLDPNHPSNMSLVNPQTYPAVDFSAYPAQNTCKAIGGRLPNEQELATIYANKVSYGNNFQANGYWSATESSNSLAVIIQFANGNLGAYTKNTTAYARCVSG